LISQVRHEKGGTVVELEGRFDATSSEETKAGFRELIDEGHVNVVVNLSGITFMDSSGLGVLVSSLRYAVVQGGDVRLAEVPEYCRSIFELTRLTRVFDINESEQEALKAFGSASS